MKEFYYNRKKLRYWAVFNLILLLIALALPAITLEQLIVATVAKLLALASALAAFYVYMEPQKLAQIDEDGIIIDHNTKLYWKDVEKIEDIHIKGCCCGRDIIRFKLKNDKKYPLTFMQKLSKNCRYGAFSIPLYAMTKEDAAKIEKEIKKHLPLSEKVKEAVKKVIKKASKSKAKSK